MIQTEMNSWTVGWVSKLTICQTNQTFLLCIQPSPVGQLGLEKPLNFLIDLGKGNIKHIKLHCQQKSPLNRITWNKFSRYFCGIKGRIQRCYTDVIHLTKKCSVSLVTSQEKFLQQPGRYFFINQQERKCL